MADDGMMMIGGGIGQQQPLLERNAANAVNAANGTYATTILEPLTLMLNQRDEHHPIWRNEVVAVAKDALMKVDENVVVNVANGNNNDSATMIVDRLITILEQRDGWDFLRVQVDEVARDTLTKLQNAFEVYERQCRPLLETDDVPIPGPVRERCRELAAAAFVEHGDEEVNDLDQQVNVTSFVKSIQGVLHGLLENNIDDPFWRGPGRWRRPGLWSILWRGPGRWRRPGLWSIHNIEDSLFDEVPFTGFDSELDTEEEVETILRIFPEVLFMNGRPGVLMFMRTPYLAFVPMIAQLRIELSNNSPHGRFDDREWLGLFGSDCSLKYLMTSSDIDTDMQLRDQSAVAVLRRLWDMDVFKKADIRNCALLQHLLGHNRHNEVSSIERRFRFLVSCNPNALVHVGSSHSSSPPLLDTAYCKSIEFFEFIFKAGIRYFPRRKGINLLFNKCRVNWYDNFKRGDTPFTVACEHYGSEQAIKAIEDVLVDCSNEPLMDTSQAFLLAVVDDNISLDGVNFLLRREPDILAKLLSSVSTGDDHDDDEVENPYFSCRGFFCCCSGNTSRHDTTDN